jgi:hypothetical protein
MEDSMDHDSMPFGIKLSAFLAAIAVLTFAVAAIAPESSEDAPMKLEYAALSY